MLAATLAIAGVPPLAGFFSKDEILGHTFERSHLLWSVGWITAGMTAFYMFRLFFLTFHGQSRVDHEVEHHIHESPNSMTVPLMILAALAIIGGWIGIGHRFERFLEPVVTIHHETHVERVFGREGLLAEAGKQSVKQELEEHTPLAPGEEYVLMFASVGIGLAGIGMAWFLYLKRTDLPAKIATSFGGFYRTVYNKYYVDQIYDAMFVNRAKDLGLALGAFDRNVIDGAGVNGAGWLTRAVARLSMWWDTWIVDGSVRLGARIVWLFSYPVRMIQDGLVQSYMLLVVIGLIGFLAYYWHIVHQAVR
jgi:NADH-quinone oxidoreductase subunit L